MSFSAKAKKKLTAYLYQKHHLRITRGRLDRRRHDKDLNEFLLGLYRDGRVGQQIEELYILYQLTKLTEPIVGDIAEVGVFQGGTAKLIATLKKNRSLHLFDSFCGMLETTDGKDLHQKGDFTETSVESVKKYLAEFAGIHFYPGWFPETAEPVKDKTFSLVHLDVDLYKSTLDALEFFYPRLNRGGFIVSHDYHSIVCPGVGEAFEKFFQGKPESILSFPQSLQAAVQKL
ncbi:MAG: macrocin-O-methyltransferase [Planctomycetes bacterium]|nr:macrocin-O-methyltransferase [Planctomycetota bacterium]